MDELLAQDTQGFLLFVLFLLAAVLTGHGFEHLVLLLVRLDLDEVWHRNDLVAKGPSRLTIRV